MKNFTLIPNEILEESQLSITTRYLLCVLLKFSGQNDWCYPNQKTLGKNLDCSPRHIRNLLGELELNGLIVKRRTGFNKPNNYKVSKEYTSERKYGSCHIGSKFPVNQGTAFPSKNTYVKTKSKRRMEIEREKLTEKGIIRSSQIVLKGLSNNYLNVTKGRLMVGLWLTLLSKSFVFT
jgi:hypothetical protein